MAKRGIDISAHQGNIDLNALKGEIDFVIIRVGYGVSGTIDKYFKRNADLCVELGIPFGFYWYSYALDESGAESEANAFLNAIAPYKDKYSYGCWFDMEDADSYKSKHGMPSNQTLRNICNRFCTIVQNNGYYVGIYASSSWFNNQLNGAEISPFDKWVAQWPTSGGRERGLDVSADERTQYNLWQFTSAARFNNYGGNLDANYAYRDYPQIIRGGQPAPQPTPTPEPQYSFRDFVGDVQRAIGARVDKIPGPETLSKTPTVSKTKNRKHAVIKPIQKYLYSLGYTEVGDADGIAGNKFEVAVKNYQRDHGCVVDGEITAHNKTWKKLLKLA